MGIDIYAEEERDHFVEIKKSWGYKYDVGGRCGMVLVAIV